MDNKLKIIAEGQDQIIIAIMNDARIPSYIRDYYAEEYNELHLKVTEGQPSEDV